MIWRRNRAGIGARTLGNGDGGGLGHSVGLGAIGESGGRGAEGGVDIGGEGGIGDDLSMILPFLGPRIGGRGQSEDGESVQQLHILEIGDGASVGRLNERRLQDVVDREEEVDSFFQARIDENHRERTNEKW